VTGKAIYIQDLKLRGCFMAKSFIAHPHAKIISIDTFLKQKNFSGVKAF